MAHRKASIIPYATLPLHVVYATMYRNFNTAVLYVFRKSAVGIPQWHFVRSPKG